MFEPYLQINKHKDNDEEIKNRRINGARLALTIPTNSWRTLQEAITGYVIMLAKRHNFTLFMAHFASREAESLAIWEVFFVPKLLSIRLRVSKEHVKILRYQPNLVSWQFRLNHILPKSFFSRKNKLFLCNITFSKDEYIESLGWHATDTSKLTSLSFWPYFYYRKEFDSWYRAYFAEELFGASFFSQHLTNAFSFMQMRFKKGREKHIKEIQSFLRYFETIYRPRNLSWTIHEAMVTLREKLLAKLLDLKFSHNIEDKYQFALKFHTLKIPHLASSELTFAFRPPFPWWFMCGSHLSVLKNEFLKSAKWVVPTKYDLDSFKGRFHVE